VLRDVTRRAGAPSAAPGIGRGSWHSSSPLKKAAGKGMVVENPMAQQLESDLRTSPGARFSLRDFTGEGRDRGVPFLVFVLWLLVSRCLTMHWWCPNQLRVLVLRGFGARIGTGVLIRHDVKIDWPWKLEIGNDTWIGESTWIINAEPVVIGSNTCISQGVLLCSGSHDRFSPTLEFDNAPIVIGDSVWICTRATILRGVRVGDGVTIGATALVTGDVPEAATVLAPRGTRR
jgi:putative colanic acid biosynthesis acetyltransferase WcaF